MSPGSGGVDLLTYMVDLLTDVVDFLTDVDGFLTDVIDSGLAYKNENI